MVEHKTGERCKLVATAKVFTEFIMKRHGNLFCKIIATENIIEAHRIARDKKTKKRSVKKVDAHIEEYAEKLHNMLKDGTYKTSDYKLRMIYEPKERMAFILPYFPDRIFQHALANILEPIWSSMWIEDSYSCKKGKGQHKGSMKCMKYVQKYRYCLQCDLSKFYASIPHDLLKAEIRRKIKCARTLNLLDEIIDSSNRKGYFMMMLLIIMWNGDVITTRTVVNALWAVNRKIGYGVPIGNYISQPLGNLHLNYLDQLMIHRYKVPGYVRYCDDFVIFSNNKKELNYLKHEIIHIVENEYRMRLSKADIFPVSRGVDFLGYRHFPGKYILLRKRTAKRAKKRMRKILPRLYAGKIKKERALSMIGSTHGLLKWGNTHNLRMSMEVEKIKKEVMDYEEV